MRRPLDLVALAAATLALAACGGGDGDDELIVSAASSLQAPLQACAAGARLQFAGSDELAAQIRQGVRPDVLAAANTKLPEQLASEGLLERPVVFATNSLVLAVADEAEIDDVGDLARGGVRLAIGSEGVPVGDYTREVLGRLGDEQERAILASVRSEEPDVKGIVGKVSQGAADAGFVYRTDAQAADLRAITPARELQPEVAYGAGVVEGSETREDAEAFVAGLTEGRCAEALRDAGFGAPPR